VKRAIPGLTSLAEAGLSAAGLADAAFASAGLVGVWASALAAAKHHAASANPESAQEWLGSRERNGERHDTKDSF
jgi:hypothetical protein